MHVFIDESGDLGSKGSRFFILIALMINDEKECTQILKRARNKKMKKTLSRIPELKGCNSNERIRKFVFSKISKLKCKIIYLAIKKRKIESQKQLYVKLLTRLITEVSLQNPEPLQVTLDRTSLLQGLSFIKNRKILDSQNSTGLQIADFVAWALFRHFEYNDSEYFDYFQETCKRLE